MVGDARDAGAAEGLVALLNDPAPRARFFAAEALGRAGVASSFAAIVGMLAASDDADVYLRTAGIHALASLGNRPALVALRTHASRGVRLAAVVALRRLKDPAVAGFLEDADPLVVIEAARAINDEGGIPAALPPLARLLDGPVTGDPLVRRVLNANLRVGNAQAAGRIGNFIRRPGVSNAMRVEAVQILGVWVSPSTMDRVDGEYLGATFQTREGAAAAEVVTSLVPLIDAPDSAPELKIAMIESVARLSLKTASTALVGRLRQDSSPQVRVPFNALQTLAELTR
jgi:HEAT repeat protein